MIINKQGIKGQIRQGDILIQPIEQIPEKAISENITEDKRFIVATGDSLPFAHYLESEKAQIVGFNGIRYIEAFKKTRIKHEGTHTDLPIQKGKNQILHQREYTPEEIRNVAD